MPAMTHPARVEGGANIAFAAAANDDTINPVNGSVLFEVNNGSGASINVTLAATTTTYTNAAAGTLTRANIVVAVPAGESRIISAPSEPFVNGAGLVPIAYSSLTSVTRRPLPR